MDGPIGFVNDKKFICLISNNCLLSFSIFKFIRDENENELALVTPRSQLHFAIWLGNKDVFQTIWDKIGAKDKTEPDETDMVPLQYAAEYGDCEIFKTIYENSVDKDPRGRYGYSLLHHAADNGRFEIIDEILKKVRFFLKLFSDCSLQRCPPDSKNLYNFY